MKLNVIFTLATFILTASTSTASFAAEEAYGPFNLDGGHIACKSPSGDEIKKTQNYRATGDRFFKEGSISVSKTSGWAPKKEGCEVSAVRRQLIKVTSDVGEFEVSVIKDFDVYVYADCGTDIARYVGKTASIECSVGATLVKYTNK